MQTEILPAIPSLARYITFSLSSADNLQAALEELSGFATKHNIVVGIGLPLAQALGADISGLKAFPDNAYSSVSIPATQGALWCWLKSDDRGKLVHHTYELKKILSPNFSCSQVVDAFRHGLGFDLTGYEDGTENPEGEEAIEAAFLQNDQEGLSGSSFVAIQQWQHNFDQFNDMSENEQDNSIGRRKSDNIELEDAPKSAHVKRTAQEDFDPEAFLLRRSMPWADAEDSGLYFVAFGKSFYAFEAQLKRMSGDEDGIQDALFKFTKPISGSYFWCPPINENRLDFRALGF